MLLISNLSRCIPSNVNLTVCVHYTRYRSITLHLMLSDGLRKYVEQPGLGFLPHVRQSKVPTLEVDVDVE